MKRSLLVFTSYLFLLGCTYAPIPKYIQKEFIGVFENNYTGLDTVININGYYSEDFKDNYWLRGRMRFSGIHKDHHSDFLFLPNGQCFYGSYYNATELDFKHNEKPKGNCEYILWSAPQKGVYSIQGDTIHVKVVNHPSLLSRSWYAFEAWYKIMDRNTLQLVAHRGIDINIDREGKNFKPPVEYIDDSTVAPATFYSVNNMQSCAEIWLQNEKWFWKNMNDYEKWKHKR